MKKQSVLILAADGTQTLPVAESLHNHGYEVHGLFGNKMSYGYACRYFDCKTIIHSLGHDDYLGLIKDYVSQKEINVLFPMSDVTAEILSLNKKQLEEIVRIVTPNYECFRKGYDKNQLMHVCSELGIPHPRTIDLEIVNIDDIDDNIFPALIKPNITTGGRGMTLVTSREDFLNKYDAIHIKYGECHLQEFIKAGGRQLKAQLFVDKEGELLCSSVMHKQRYYPEKGGSSSCNTTIKKESVINSCLRILQHIRWEGFADFDLIEDPKDGAFKVMEINPRVPACIKSAIKSGADYPELFVDYALGKEVKQYHSQEGYTLRHLGFETLWFIHSKDRFKAKPSWFQFIGKRIYYQDFSIKDPLPFFCGSYENIMKLMNPSFLKQKSGLK